MLSRDVSRALARFGIATEVSKPMMATTIISSVNVNPWGGSERKLVFIRHTRGTSSKPRANLGWCRFGPRRPRDNVRCFRREYSHLWEKPGQTGGQKDTLVRCILPIHMGPPP